MSFVGSLFSNSQGAGFQATGATNDQATTALGTSSNALNQQNAFAQALAAQNGIGNQNNVYSQLQGIANGTGPNPAQAQLNQATGANVANQAALMAGQRGASSNVGLMARQAAQQGANTQQQAAGQAATMQANQQMNAINSMGNIANQQVSNQAGALNAYSSAAQGEQGTLLNSIANQNNNNAAIAAQNAKNQAAMFNSTVNGAGTMLSSLAHGGKVKKMASGGQVQNFDGGGDVGAPLSSPVSSSGPQSNIGKYFSQVTNQTNAQTANAGANDPGMTPGMNGIGKAVGQGLKKMFSPSNTPSGAPASGGQMPGSSMSDYQNLNDFGNNAQDYNNITSPGDAQANALDSSGPVAGDAVDSGADAAAGDAAAGAADAGASAAGGLGDLAALASKGGKISKAKEQEIPEQLRQYLAGGGLAGLMPLLMMANRGGQMPTSNGGKQVPVMLSPGEKALAPQEAKAVVNGQADIKQVGKVIPGKAKVKGDSLKNDIVPDQLEEGSIVIPRSHMKDMSSALKFVHAHMRKERALKGGK